MSTTYHASVSSGYSSSHHSPRVRQPAVEVKRGYGIDPMFATRYMRSYSQENLNLGLGRSTETGLYTPRSKTFHGGYHGARRTVSWSHVPRGGRESSTVGFNSRVTTPRSLPGIPWGQVPGLSGFRTGTISPIDSEGYESPTQMLPKGHDYLKRAKLITKVLFTEAARIHRRFPLCFTFSMYDSPQKGEEIRQRLGTSDIFDVTLVLRPPIPSDAFEIVSTLPRDVPPGHAVARLNPSLTPAERVSVKRTWGPLLLADEYLTPCLAHKCIEDALQKAIVSLDKVTIGRDLYGIMIYSNAPELSLVVSFINLDTTAENTTSSFTLNIIPIIIAAGVPRISGFQLRMPTPHVLPYSRVGLEVMREFDLEMSDWSLFWKLEGRFVKSKKKPVIPGFMQGVVTKRTRKKKEERDVEMSRPLPQETHLKSWVISFEPLEKRLLELCLKRDFFQRAKEAFELFDSIAADLGEDWTVFPPSLTTSLKLWTIFKTSMKNKTVLDWLMSLLLTMHDCLKLRFCSYFLMPRINMLNHVDRKKIDALRKQLHDLVRAKTSKNKYDGELACSTVNYRTKKKEANRV